MAWYDRTGWRSRRFWIEPLRSHCSADQYFYYSRIGNDPDDGEYGNNGGADDGDSSSGERQLATATLTTGLCWG
ncbi:unnamed protein product [Gongylonema pulchrum]|uniref:DUF2510 domain-containing protein n=1 Tax=Gongylonema pulchrum TaxID=637853 RepID=A0A183E392_9BILA|nr:unnamed protein product [Gongylonema pulchrum]